MMVVHANTFAWFACGAQFCLFSYCFMKNIELDNKNRFPLFSDKVHFSHEHICSFHTQTYHEKMQQTNKAEKKAILCFWQSRIATLSHSCCLIAGKANTRPTAKHYALCSWMTLSIPSGPWWAKATFLTGMTDPSSHNRKYKPNVGFCWNKNIIFTITWSAYDFEYPIYLIQRYSPAWFVYFKAVT